LQESEEKFKLLYEKAPVPYHTLDPDGLITDVNEKWCQTFGYEKDQVLGKSIFDFISKNERVNAKQSFLQKISQGKSYTSGHCREYQTRTGEKRQCIAHDFFLFDNNRKVISVYTTMNEITSDKQTSQTKKNTRTKMVKRPTNQSRQRTTGRKKRHA